MPCFRYVSKRFTSGWVTGFRPQGVGASADAGDVAGGVSRISCLAVSTGAAVDGGSSGYLLFGQNNQIATPAAIKPAAVTLRRIFFFDPPPLPPATSCKG